MIENRIPFMSKLVSPFMIKSKTCPITSFEKEPGSDASPAAMKRYGNKSIKNALEAIMIAFARCEAGKQIADAITRESAEEARKNGQRNYTKGRKTHFGPFLCWIQVPREARDGFRKAGIAQYITWQQKVFNGFLPFHVFGTTLADREKFISVLAEVRTSQKANGDVQWYIRTEKVIDRKVTPDVKFVVTGDDNEKYFLADDLPHKSFSYLLKLKNETRLISLHVGFEREEMP